MKLITRNDTTQANTLQSFNKKDSKRSDFISTLKMDSTDVQNVLNERITLENKMAHDSATPEALLFEKELLESINYQPRKINIVSLFSGAGGLDLGVELAGISVAQNVEKSYRAIKDKHQFDKLRTQTNVIYSNDLFEAANQTYVKNSNHKLVKDDRDIRKVVNFPKSNLMLGGFPCPGFSAAGPRLLDDPRNFLYIHYIRALMQSKPAVFIAENVKGLMTMANGQVLQQITQDFAAAGYKVFVNLVNAKDYGVPQNRERVFIIGIRNDIVTNYHFHYSLPAPTNGIFGKPFVTLRDAIEDLPIVADDVFDSSYSSIYMSRNRKKSWDDTSFTIQASGRQAPQHPSGEPMKRINKDLWEFQGDFNRRLSVRECARIQTFPDWFEFSQGNHSTNSRNNLLNEQYKQIGNAVPVYLAEKISRPIIEFLYNHPELLK